jgi:hypothetical protein
MRLLRVRLPLLRMRLSLLRMTRVLLRMRLPLLRMTRVLRRASSSSPLVMLTHPPIIDLDEQTDNRQSSVSS